MSFVVRAYAAMLTRFRDEETGEQRNDLRQQDWDAFKFAKAVKSLQINGYATVPVGGGVWRLDQGNVEEARDWFGRWGAAQLRSMKVSRPFGLVPVPSSKTTRFEDTDFLGRTLAEKIIERASGVDVELVDVLRFSTPMRAAHDEGGPRDPHTLFSAMREPALDGSRRLLLLVDDIATSGGHLRAARARLAQAGGTLCDAGALCAGKAVHHPPESAWDVDETLEDFDPDAGISNCSGR